MKNAKPISSELVAAFRDSYHQDAAAKIYSAAVSSTEFEKVTFDPVAAAVLQDHFTIDLHTSAVTDQKKTGRCWLFASMNLFREKVAENCNMERAELSGCYLAFWDKFEKINFFLEAAIDTADLPSDDRTIDWLYGGIGDGGQWDMMTAVVRKYGVVPFEVMPDNAQSTDTRRHWALLNSRLRKDMVEVRRLTAEKGEEAARARKEEMLSAYFRALCILYGEPPAKFDYTYEDKDKNYHIDRGITPLEFYNKYVGIDLSDYVSVINSPTADKPFGKSYTVKYLGSTVEQGVRYLNLPMSKLEMIVVEQLRAGEPVWFGSDCGKYGSGKTGIWDPDSYTAEKMLGLDTTMSKEDRLDFCDSKMNHAMVITGVNLDENGRPDRWKIQNSWGEESGHKGYFIGSEKWFYEFVYQIVINKKYLTEEQIAAYESDPVVLEPWDPMGALAL
ncbi:MAG: C1 family peptidase [Mogibacterium sp.]|nr:C1 family peptidase [Mogibacterium sp.]